MGKTGSSRCATTATIRASASRGHACASRPSASARPAAHGTRPSTARSRVVFPAPFGPTTATHSPARTASETSPSAGAAVPGAPG
jgi:hypothetical protein